MKTVLTKIVGGQLDKVVIGTVPQLVTWLVQHDEDYAAKALAQDAHMLDEESVIRLFQVPEVFEAGNSVSMDGYYVTQEIEEISDDS